MTSHASVDSPPAAPEQPADRSDTPLGVAAIIGLAIGILAFVVYVSSLERDLWFWFDDFTWLTTFHDGAVFEPAKSHLSAVPGALTFLVANAFGLERGYTVMRSIALVALAGLAVAMWWHLRRRVGAAVAALASLAPLWFAPNHVDVLSPTLLKHALPLLLAVIVAGRLERSEPSWRNDAITTLLIAIAVGTSTTGLVILAIVAVHLAGTGTRPARWWLLLSPGVAWLLWYAVAEDSDDQAGVSRAVTPTVREFLGHTDALVSNTFVDLGAGNPVVGFGLGVGFAFIVAGSALRWRTFGRASLRWVAAAAAFIVLTASIQNMYVLSLGEPPRYRFVLATFVLLTVGESLRGVSIDRRFVGAAAVLLVANGVVLVDGLRAQHSFMRSALAADAPLLLAAEAAGGAADPDRVIADPTVDLTTVGAYLDLIDHVGSPRDLLAAVPFNSQAATQADRILFDEVPIGEAPGTCVSTNIPGSSLTVDPGSTVSVTAFGSSADVFAVRFGELLIGLAPIATIDNGESLLLSFPDDDVPVPWRLKGTSGAVLTLC